MAIDLDALIAEAAGASTGTPVSVKVASGEAAKGKSQSGF